MTLDNWQWRNPERVLEQKQQREINRKEGAERVCSGCVHKRVILIGETKHKACAIKRGNPTIWCNHKRTEKSE
jgi:hypothetical protein